MGLKILHTADWHLGKKLLNEDLREDHRYFISFLLSYIHEHQVDVVIIAGDVFDYANPSQESLALYYNTLLQIKALGCELVISSGNHDGLAVLQAPQAMLNELGIHLCTHWTGEAMLVPIQKNNEKVVIANIPFLREKDIRSNYTLTNTEERLQDAREGIKAIYDRAADQAITTYPDHSLMMTGHLFVQGSEISDSERDIMVGTLGGFSANDFPEAAQYIALGHIHKPQSFKNKTVQYSGSPIMLSFSEVKYAKQMVLIQVENHVFTSQQVLIPALRNVHAIAGSWDWCLKSLQGIAPHENGVQDLCFIEVQEEKLALNYSHLLNDIMSKQQELPYKIIGYKISITNGLKQALTYMEQTERVNQIAPENIVKSVLEENKVEDAVRERLQEKFHRIMELIQAEQHEN